VSHVCSEPVIPKVLRNSFMISLGTASSRQVLLGDAIIIRCISSASYVLNLSNDVGQLQNIIMGSNRGTGFTVNFVTSVRMVIIKMLNDVSIMFGSSISETLSWSRVGL